MALITYRSEDGVGGYEAGDVLLDTTTGDAVRAVRTGHGVQLEPATAADVEEARAGQHAKPAAGDRATLTITLTGRAPVTIVKADWPVLASAEHYDGEVRSQANETWRLTVRQHADGRAIVYGVYDTAWRERRGKRGGELIDAGADIPQAIHRVAATVGAEEIAESCVAKLPAVEIE